MDPAGAAMEPGRLGPGPSTVGVQSSGRGDAAPAMAADRTHVVTFALLYRQVDGGGPARRVAEPAPFPDFQFPQTSPRGWRRRGAAPLRRPPLRRVHRRGRVQPDRHALRVKALMPLQSLISLSVLAVVLSRVIDLLPT